MTRVLVTGSAGFIGGYVVQELLLQGYDVIGVDNFSKYGPVKRPYDAHPSYRFVEGDCRDTELLDDLLVGTEHFIAGAAMIGGISYFHTHSYDLLANNERIMAASVDAALAAHRNGQLRKVTYMSSSMVYESTDRWPSVEGDELKVPPPLSSYGFQKLAVEYFRAGGMGPVPAALYDRPPVQLRWGGRRPGSGRYRNTVRERQTGHEPRRTGPGAKGAVGTRSPAHPGRRLPGEALYLWARPCARNCPGHATRSCPQRGFQPVDGQFVDGPRGGRVDLAKNPGPEEPFRYVSDPPFEHDVARRIPSVEKAKRLLGFEATTTLDEMLDEVIPWVRDALKEGII